MVTAGLVRAAGSDSTGYGTGYGTGRRALLV